MFDEDCRLADEWTRFLDHGKCERRDCTVPIRWHLHIAIPLVCCCRFVVDCIKAVFESKTKTTCCLAYFE